ncbi:Glutamyl-tRNA amidotransferase subunit B, mitochondrial [Microdochium trichocladiopsis]|uniref:Glutamyl-tRNA(Gln) amidotransferase subunit B, mitochondrial n=1 Tax=Microdochium trichocladiopsis TaxID=1682393 RepID=A0A9P9BSH1_9PEZI|nr:Glutamyl-tRNA amidotransferase subunit B, mitochondrial [Microdochium trichocladiopsis]KAH7028841.1 Glutamyl-tRNA amidotransferase subunit B, mitochondrial [Microdochium trichocladiopsis]
MARLPPATLRRYLLHGSLPTAGCLLRPRAPQASCSRTAPCISTNLGFHATPRRLLQSAAAATTNTPTGPAHVPLRKQLKEEAKQLKASGKKKKKNASNQVVPGWELTVGIEIHAQLNTPRKLFSPAATSFNDNPNTHVAYFDLATPGSQPIFQKETLIPALRAALALNCEIQPTSRFDRKHYFHWDQPSGYQITQYYEPFARNGYIDLQPRDGIAAEDENGLKVGIKQVQMEQDTAKTLAQPDKVHWIDFNRVGAPLIEIITHPDIHHPATAAAFVRKVQTILNATDACVSGMEAGGLRADVNVSVRRTGDPSAPLGQRTEIKNLSSFKAVEDAIIAERDRQIAVLESGGKIEGETRGWSIGATETRRLRGKEGEVDYRYMPDPDLAPVVIGDDLVAHLRETLGQLPDVEVNELIDTFELSPKDALSLVAIDGGMRVEYFWNVVDALRQRLESRPNRDAGKDTACFQLAANWTLHELGRLTADKADPEDQQLGFTEDGQCQRVPIDHLADIIFFLHSGDVTAKIAKELLWVVFRGTIPAEYASVEDLIEKEGLWFKELSEAEYEALADQAVEGQEHVVKQFADYKKYPEGKLMFLVGQMVRLGLEERINPQNAAAVLKRLLEEKYVPALKN